MENFTYQGLYLILLAYHYQPTALADNMNRSLDNSNYHVQLNPITANYLPFGRCSSLFERFLISSEADRQTRHTGNT